MANIASPDRDTFEKDLGSLSGQLKTDRPFAQRLYAALCNVDWKPIGGTHKPDCMLVTKELPDGVKERMKVITVEDGVLVENPPDPWCNCGLDYSCSWRYAGGLVADLREQGEDYLDFYCSGGEGRVASDVREALAKLGWEPESEKVRLSISIRG